MYKLFILCIAITLLFTGCQAVGRGELAAPDPSPSPDISPAQELYTPAATPALTPSPSPPFPPYPTHKHALTEKNVELFKRCLNNAIYKHINEPIKNRLELEKYDRRRIVVSVCNYISPSVYADMFFSLDGDDFWLEVQTNYLNGPAMCSFTKLENYDFLERSWKNGEFEYDFDPELEYDFENQYFDRWPQIRENIIQSRIERLLIYESRSGEEYWLRFFKYTEEYAMKPGEAAVYYIFESVKPKSIEILCVDIAVDGKVSVPHIIDVEKAGLDYYRKQVFDEVKIMIP